MEVDGEQFEDAKEGFDNPEVGGKDKDNIKGYYQELNSFWTPVDW